MAEDMFKTTAERTGEAVAEGTQTATDALKAKYMSKVGEAAQAKPANPQEPSPADNQQQATAEEAGTQESTSTLQEASAAQNKLHRRRGQTAAYSQPKASDIFGGQ